MNKEIRMNDFKPYSETFLADLTVDGEDFLVLFRVVNEVLNEQEIYDYDTETPIKTKNDTIRMEVERIFHHKKDETFEIATTKPGFYDRILAFLINHFIHKEKRWMRKTKKTQIVANYKSFKFAKTIPPTFDKEKNEVKEEVKTEESTKGTLMSKEF